MPYEPVRYAIISPARWGRGLLNAVQASSKLLLRAVWSRSPENAADVVKAYGGRVYQSFEAVLADDEVEAVVLPTPHFLHHPQTMAALAAGKHVFVEKPIAVTLLEAQEMQRASEDRQLVLAVGHQGRRTGAARKAKEMLREGRLGRVTLAVAVHGAPIAHGYSDADWETRSEYNPGGPLDSLGVHYADLMRYLLGPIRRVSGFYNRSVTPFEVPDAAAASFEFESGVVGTYSTHQVSAYTSKLTIFGSEGALHIDRFGQDLTWQDRVDTQAAKREGPSLKPVSFDGPLPFTTALTEELEEFADCIRLGGTPEVGATEGMAALQVVRAVMEAHESGHVVTLGARERSTTDRTQG